MSNESTVVTVMTPVFPHLQRLARLATQIDSGKPVIGGNTGGVPDAIVPGETGYLVDPTNEDALKEAILDLLQNPVKARQMGENGRKRVEKELSWDRLVEDFDEELAHLFGTT